MDGWRMECNPLGVHGNFTLEPIVNIALCVQLQDVPHVCCCVVSLGLFVCVLSPAFILPSGPATPLRLLDIYKPGQGLKGGKSSRITTAGCTAIEV